MTPEPQQTRLDRDVLMRTLENERSRLRAVIEQAPAFIVTLAGPDHVIEIANEQYYRLINRRDVIGKTVREVLPEVVEQGFIDLLDSVYRTGEPYVGNEVPAVLGPQGAATQRFVNFIYQPQRGVDGRVTGIFVHGIDVTETVRAREAAVAREALLRTSEERLAFAVEAGELGTFYCPMPMGRIVWNAKCKEHFWLPAEAEVDFDRFYAIIHPDDVERTRDAVEQAIFRRVGYDIEYRTVSPEGRFRWVRAKGRAYYGADGEPTRFDGVTLDITAQKRAEAERAALLDRERAARGEAERAGRMKDEFLATLSHELRTPLNAVLGWSQIMRQSKDEADLRQGLDVIERNARAQAQIIEDLLDMSRIISGKVRLDVQQLDLSATVRSAVDTAKPTADAKGVRLVCVIDAAQAMSVKGDAGRLQQVLWNLLSNAIKFTPNAGEVRVSLGRANSQFDISVTDTGEGIAPEFLPHVFDRFRQADATTTRRHGGLGLGLSIVKQLVELHGGSIRVSSDGPGRGATFVVSLPIVATQAAEAMPARTATRAAEVVGVGAWRREDLAGVRVLVIDDEPDARSLIQRLLEECDAVVTATDSANQIVASVGTGGFDVLISDIGMPGEDGYALIDRVRRLDPTRGGKIPAIALTAYARIEDQMKAVAAGFQVHVAKPVEPAELLARVASVVGRSRR